MTNLGATEWFYFLSSSIRRLRQFSGFPGISAPVFAAQVSISGFQAVPVCLDGCHISCLGLWLFYPCLWDPMALLGCLALCFLCSSIPNRRFGLHPVPRPEHCGPSNRASASRDLRVTGRCFLVLRPTENSWTGRFWETQNRRTHGQAFWYLGRGAIKASQEIGNPEAQMKQEAVDLFLQVGFPESRL